MTAKSLVGSLPDRPLSMDEAERVAKAFNAHSMNRMTFDGEAGDKRVWMINLLVDGTFFMLCHAGEWDIDVIARDLRDNEFYDALDSATRRVFDTGVERSETIWWDDDGDEIDRYDATTVDDQDQDHDQEGSG